MNSCWPLLPAPASRPYRCSRLFPQRLPADRRHMIEPLRRRRPRECAAQGGGSSSGGSSSAGFSFAVLSPNVTVPLTGKNVIEFEIQRTGGFSGDVTVAPMSPSPGPPHRAGDDPPRRRGPRS